VVKVGSAVLAGPRGLDLGVMAEIARQVLALKAAGREVVLVSSGAVAAGMAATGLPRPEDMPRKQALAAIGQPLLMAAWREAFRGVPVAQVLLTAEDLASRERYLNAKATLKALLELGAIPIINENDTVAFQEIRFGDNDQLSARVAAPAPAPSRRWSGWRLCWPMPGRGIPWEAGVCAPSSLPPALPEGWGYLPSFSREEGPG